MLFKNSVRTYFLLYTGCVTNVHCHPRFQNRIFGVTEKITKMFHQNSLYILWGFKKLSHVQLQPSRFQNSRQSRSRTHSSNSESLELEWFALLDRQDLRSREFPASCGSVNKTVHTQDRRGTEGLTRVVINCSLLSEHFLSTLEISDHTGDDNQ
jgi:hypothetical protein